MSYRTKIFVNGILLILNLFLFFFNMNVKNSQHVIIINVLIIILCGYNLYTIQRERKK